jgi:TonB-linked SusC/RagA family outer membrane protein
MKRLLPLLFSFCIIVNGALAQTGRITGTIKNPTGEPLAGATVQEKGTTNSVISDTSGHFSITITRPAAVLQVSFAGYQNEDVKLAGKTSVQIVLQIAAASNLNDVVVIGYGYARRKDLTGSIASVKAKDIALSPVSSPMEALQGRVSGLDIQRTSGQAGTSPDVLLRGNRSINGGQEPLYIIDGIPGDINNLNPYDIETIDVLKDASATAIYGVQGANGVIMVTTKKAVAGKLQVDVNSYYGINGFASFPRPQYGDKWIEYMKDRYRVSTGNEPTQPIDYLTPEMISLLDKGQWVNWVDETLRQGAQQNHYISLRGGNDKLRGYLTLGYAGEKGIYKYDQVNIFSSRSGLDFNFNKFIKAGIQNIVSVRNGESTNSRVNKAYGLVPLGVPYNPDGSINVRPLGASNATVSPIANYAPGVYIDEEKSLSLNVYPYVEISPVRNLMIRSNFGVTLSGSRSGGFENERSYNMLIESRVTKQGTYETGVGYNYNWETFASYNFKFKEDHQFSVTALTSMAKSKDEESSLIVTGLDYDKYLFYNMGAGTNVTSRSTKYEETSRMSYGGRLNYNYKGKYFLTASNRWDGASQLVDHWASFPSVAVAWRISDENFMATTSSWLNYLKIRASYGVTGNSKIDPYQGLTEVVSKTSASLSLGGTAMLPVFVLKQALANPDLTWEKSYSANLALEMSLFDNKIDITAEAYHTNTKGVLYRRKMPFTSGGFDAKNAYTKASNIAETENDGIEIAINSKNINTPTFQWTSTLIFTMAKERLVGINLGNKDAATQLISEGLFPGHPLKSYYGYNKIGIWQYADTAQARLYGARAGDIRLATVPLMVNGVSDKGVHVYSPADRMVLGHQNPDFYLGFQNNFTYKNFDLTVFITMRYGQTINAQLLGYWNTVAQPESYDYWMPDNPTNDFPRPGSGFSSTYSSALAIVDASYLKIKNLTFGYSLPQRAAKKIGLSRLRVYGTAYNPLIFVKNDMLKDVDPETGGTDSFPLYKQIVFGINLSF